MAPLGVQFVNVPQVRQLQLRVQLRLLVEVLVHDLEVVDPQELQHLQDALDGAFPVLGLLRLELGQVLEDPLGLLEQLVVSWLRAAAITVLLLEAQLQAFRHVEVPDADVLLRLENLLHLARLEHVLQRVPLRLLDLHLLALALLLLEHLADQRVLRLLRPRPPFLRLLLRLLLLRPFRYYNN